MSREDAPDSPDDATRQSVAAHFRARIPALLAAWRAQIAADGSLVAGRTLPRAQLHDHLPHWLEDFAAALAAPPQDAGADSAAEKDADQHGTQRWQQGFDLREVMREWASLQGCLVAELERFCASLRPAPPHAVLLGLRLRVARLVSDAMIESASRYAALERVEAAGNVRDLDGALRSLREVEQERAALWHEAAHDLRGNLGVVSNVAHGLTFADLPAERRDAFVRLLLRNLDSMHRLLDDVTDLARLQAGHERRRVEPFDAGALLRSLGDELRPMAVAKRLELRCEGPEGFAVEGDPVKTRRIAQNLLLNAIRYTDRGSVVLSWGPGADAVDSRWAFAVTDTGPGFHAGPGAPLIEAIGEATHEAQPGAARRPALGDDRPASADDRPVHQEPGEGIGLAIVKRLCEVLDATVQVDSQPGRGTQFRIVLPRRYLG